MENKLSREELYRITENFINLSTLDYKSKFFYPFLDFNNNIFNKTDHLLNSKEFAAILSQENKKIFTNHYSAKRKIFFSLRTYDFWWQKFNEFPKVKKIIKKIKNYFDNNLKNCGRLILHGSFSTLDFIPGWSDLDFIVLLNKGIIQDKNRLLYIRKKLNNIRYLFYSVDPVQHHGFFILPEEILVQYSENIFPIETIKNAIMLSGENKIEINIDEKDCNAAEKILFEFYDASHIKPKNLFEWKLYISKALLMPALFLESKGIFVYKKDSFTMINKYLNKEEKKLLKRIETIRKQWKIPLWIKLVIIFITRLGNNPFLPLIPSLLFNWKGNKRETFKLIEDFSKCLIQKIK